MYSTVRPMGKQGFFVRGCVRMRARVSSLKDVLGLFAGGKFFQIKTKRTTKRSSQYEVHCEGGGAPKVPPLPGGATDHDGC